GRSVGRGRARERTGYEGGAVRELDTAHAQAARGAARTPRSAPTRRLRGAVPRGFRQPLSPHSNGTAAQPVVSNALESATLSRSAHVAAIIGPLSTQRIATMRPRIWCISLLLLVVPTRPVPAQGLLDKLSELF